MRYYIDTCVWIDFIEGRTDDDFLSKCILNDDVVIYSYPLEKELLKYLNLSKFQMIYSILSANGLIDHVEVADYEKHEAFMLSKDRNVPFTDALHAILSRDNDAVIVTRDKHFILLRDIVEIILL